MEVPDVLLSGDHAAVAAWRHRQRLDLSGRRASDSDEPR